MATTASRPPAIDASMAPSAPQTAPGQKRGKAKKAGDPVNTSKAIEDTIAQLERNKNVDKEQEIEIEREVKRANRDLSSLLSKLETPLNRLDALQRKYTEMFAEMKRTERELIKAKKRAEQLQKEKDSNRSELGKTTTVKDKLEKLCRELQKENKKLKDDNKRVSEQETAAREELHKRLETMAGEVQEFIDLKEHPENQPANVETDEIFRHKFKSFIDQYEMREIQFHALLRTKELEVQYQVARFEQQRKAQEQEANKSRQLTSQVSTFSQTETELRSQLNIYVEKFKQVEDTLNNSNDLFLTFRKEMEEMSKKTKRLEKENHTLTRQHEQTKQNALQMAEDRVKMHKDMDMLRRKNANLEKLCRGMQQQGRGIVPAAAANASSSPGVAGTVAAGHDIHIGLESEEGSESEYEYSEGDEDDEDEEGLGSEEEAFEEPPEQASEGSSADLIKQLQLQGQRYEQLLSQQGQVGADGVAPLPLSSARRKVNGQVNGTGSKHVAL